MFLIDLIGDAIIESWFSLMQLIVPQKALGKYTRVIIKVIVEIFTCLLFMSLVLGFFAIISDDPDTCLLGQYMVFIPLGISLIQIVFGIIVRIIEKKKK